MYILGISCFYHDAAAALIKDGMLIAAAEEERFSRVKHDSGFPEQAIRFCLETAGIESRALDFVVFYEKPFRKFERLLTSIIRTYPRSCEVFVRGMKNWLLEKLWVKNIIREKLSVAPDTILFAEHHLAHAASAFFVSPFRHAALLTIDGVGEWDTGTLGYGDETSLSLTHRLHFPHSLGLLYSAFTAFLGFEVNEGEYKVMGMAAYGTPCYADRIHDTMLTLAPDGSFCLNLEYFTFHHSAQQSFSKKFAQLFGPPRLPDEDFFTNQFDYPAYFGDKPANYAELCQCNQHYADIAASIQQVAEDIILCQARYLHGLTGSPNLCIAGGVGLNSAANGRLLREGPFKDIFIQPAAGDSGGALGAALYVYHSILGNPRTFVMEHASWGKAYHSEQIRDFLTHRRIPFREFSDESALLDAAVERLCRGKVLGWFQGRFEWGPRALGNRSILADPRDPRMKDIVNTKIKFREPFRPFAPVILEERLADFFDYAGQAAAQYPSRFMLFVLPVRPDKRRLIPAVDHQGTGRVQTIREEWNGRYYRLVKRFGEKTGVPVLLNTSFNLRGEPIVNTPENAYTTFMNSGLDALVLENFLIEKDSI